MIKIRPYKLDSKVLSSSELDLNLTNIKKIANDKNESTITLYEDANHVDGSPTIINNLIVNSEEDKAIACLNNHITDEPLKSYQPLNNHIHSPHYYNNQSSDIANNLTDSFYKQHNLINDQKIVKSISKRPKPILISYVRKEAEQHARNLKAQLTLLGCDVYLDVDEIKVGMDWQDALNDAVNNCEIFIPLVTPNYGLTLWTNREVKFADIKEKLIVPINFLKQWPPTVLAIQVSSRST